MMASGRSTRFRRLSTHALRITMLVLIVSLIHLKQARVSRLLDKSVNISPSQVAAFFSDAASIGKPNRYGALPVLDVNQERLGYVLQTSPQGDHVIGFSGPTNVLVAFGVNDRIRGIDGAFYLRSGTQGGAPGSSY